MNTHARPTVHALLILTLSGIVPILGGCGGSKFGSELTAEPKPRGIRKTQSVTVSVPADEPFSIAIPRASREPGLDGTADADANANGDGTASVSAAVTHSGTAEGLFQLGHGFANQTDLQMDFDFTVRVRYDLQVSEIPELSLPDATAGLKLYARDTQGRLLRDMTLVDNSSETGATRQEADKTVEFTLTLGPHTAINVFLAGQARVEIPADRTASPTASSILKVDHVEIELKTRPAPPVRAATDERQ